MVETQIVEAIKRYLRKHGCERLEPRAALIDMDGTLYDSMRNHASAWTSVSREAGWDLTEKEVYEFEGRTGASTINELVRRNTPDHRDATDEEKKNWYKRKTEYFNMLPPVEPMPGAAQMLAALKTAGIERVLVTGSGQSSLLSRLDTDYPGIFNDRLRITSADVKYGKPHPEPYLKAMELVDVKPWQAIVVENAPMGVESGAVSQAFTVGVVTGPLDRSQLLDKGADIVYDSMPEFAESLPRLLHAMRQISATE